LPETNNRWQWRILVCDFWTVCIRITTIIQYTCIIHVLYMYVILDYAHPNNRRFYKSSLVFKNIDTTKCAWFFVVPWSLVTLPHRCRLPYLPHTSITTYIYVYVHNQFFLKFKPSADLSLFAESALNFPIAIHISARVWMRNLFHIDFNNGCVRTDSTSAHVGAGIPFF